ncbi:MAG: hypothetical protein Q9224_007276, partial [Gallowayella concinna]
PGKGRKPLWNPDLERWIMPEIFPHCKAEIAERDWLLIGDEYGLTCCGLCRE